ncbi:MAG: NADH-quinone oxidoreductase subunit J [Deltaproteobacteria bacterium]|nr:MAG: NADH-quinone oxidoreductase subunit J [Deltaproteobacteria bacterium]
MRLCRWYGDADARHGAEVPRGVHGSRDPWAARRCPTRRQRAQHGRGGRVSLPAATLFVVTAIFAIAGALVTISARRPLRAAIGLLIHIISLAGMFLTLDAQLLAVLQLLVYAGAVVVLFVFVIMLIGPAAEVGPIQGRVASRTLSIAMTVAVALAVSTTVAYFEAPWGAVSDEFGTVEGLGMAIYKQALVPFEVISITLLVAIIGAIAIARSRTE